MKRLIIIASILLLLIIIPLVGWWLVRLPLPALDGIESLAALQKSTVIRFDKHAVPYIEAYDELDAYAAQGYATARERMYQMEIWRRSARGELSEIFGPSCLEADQLMRIIGFRLLAENELEKLSPPAKAALEAYSKGVNAYLHAYRDKLPLEFGLLGFRPRQWHPEDCLIIIKYFAYKQDESWRLDDFRQRVVNKVGANMAADLFRDDLKLYGGEAAGGSKQVDKSKSSTTESTDKSSKESSKEDSIPTTQNKNASPWKTSWPATLQGHIRPAIETVTEGDRTFHQADRRNQIQPDSADLLAALAIFGERAHRRDNISPLLGSASWAVPSTLSRSGGALLACDKDSDFVTPCAWYLCSLNAPGLHVAGATMPGVPGIIFGRNEEIGWGTANMKADVQDLFFEQFKTPFEQTYKTAGGWAKADVRMEVIPVRFAGEVQQQVWQTLHGPVLQKDKLSAVALSWTGFNTEHPAFETFYAINHASDWQQFNKALETYCDPPQLFIYADRKGNIGTRAAGFIPVRADGADGTLLNKGWLPKGKWLSPVPFEKLPQAFIGSFASNSKQPLIAANQAPATSGSALPRVGPGIMLGHNFNPPYRANRLLAAISSAATSVSLADMNALQADQYSPLAPLVAETLRQAAIGQQPNLVDRNCLWSINRLFQWNGQLRASSVEASIYEAFLQTLQRRLLEPMLGRPMTTEYMRRWPGWLMQTQRVLEQKSNHTLPPEERTFRNFIITTLTQALKSLTITFNTTDMSSWCWGKIHRAWFIHVGNNETCWYNWCNWLFDQGPVGLGGASECINSCDSIADGSAIHYDAVTGPTERMLLDMSDHAKFYQGLSTGQSGHLFSPFRQDQMPSWLRVDLQPIAFSSDQVIKQAQHRLTLDNGYSR